ncbi:50S ribosomal protein L3 [Elusimicrobiota bacterium]
MIQGLLGKKIGMSLWFDHEGNSMSVTLISCGPCFIVAKEKDRIQIGYEIVRESRLGKPETGYLKKKNLPPLKYLKQVSWLGKEEDQPEVGNTIDGSVFGVGEIIDIQGISKGKGFAGVVKRWGFKGGPASHGARCNRAPGSIGASSYPSRVWPGLKMAGRKGGVKVTNTNIEILEIDTNENIIAVKGSVPGVKKGLVFLKRNAKGKSGKNNGS